MKLDFQYDEDKDIDNFINGTKAINSNKTTKFQSAFSEKYGDNFEWKKLGNLLKNKIWLPVLMPARKLL